MIVGRRNSSQVQALEAREAVVAREQVPDVQAGMFCLNLKLVHASGYLGHGKGTGGEKSSARRWHTHTQAAATKVRLTPTP